MSTEGNHKINTVYYRGHYSVLKEEAIKLLHPEISGVWIDGTLGEAGHASYALSIYPDIHLIGLDADQTLIERASSTLKPFAGRYTLINQFFDNFFQHYSSSQQQSPATILLDLGLCMFHYKKANRGFSYSETSSLDMRLNPSLPTTAYDILHTATEKELKNIFWLYAEEKKSSLIAKTIISERNNRPIESADQLTRIIEKVTPNRNTCTLHPATKIFQALRIAVNNELERLQAVLPLSFSSLAIGGKLGIITFHSLEDRIVKHYFQRLAQNCQCKPNQLICRCPGAYAKNITPKGIVASPKEISENSPSRSARLRVIQKLRFYDLTSSKIL